VGVQPQQSEQASFSYSAQPGNGINGASMALTFR
jgi:hypothetical protein